jgi:hypothetical protein
VTFYSIFLKPLARAHCCRSAMLDNQEDVIERILCHLGLWQEGVRGHCGTYPGETTLDPAPTTPFSDYDIEPVVARSSPPETSGSARVRLPRLLFSGSQS